MDYLVMHKDTIVAKYVLKSLVLIEPHLAPIYLVKTKDFEGWLQMRAIDSHRSNSRLLKKALRLEDKDDISIVLKVNAKTITDNYWVKQTDSKLCYSDVVFNQNKFSTLALYGNYDSFNRAMNETNQITPELTNIGSFEKCWKSVKGVWWMYKKANNYELFSELFVYELGLKVGLDMAYYERGYKNFIKTKDFTNNASVNFEPAFSFMKDNENYIETIEELNTMSPILVKPYIQMIFLDSIVANPDRHTFNFGVLRDVNTGEILSLSPYFDSNMALIARGYPKNTLRKNDALIKLFNIVDFIMNGYRQIC